MSEPELTTAELVSTIQGSLKSVQQYMNIIDMLSKDYEDNMEWINNLQQVNVENAERMSDLQKQNVENMGRISDLQKQNLEKRESIQKLREDVKRELASFDENLKKIPQTIDEYPRNSLESLFPGSGQSEPNVSTTEGNNDDFPTITIGPVPELIYPTPAWLDTDTPESRAAIESTQGPLSPGALKDFLDKVKLKKSPHKIALKYTRDFPSLICQLSYLQRVLEGIPSDSDRRLGSRLRNLIVNLLRYYKGPGAKEQGSNTLFKYLSPIQSNQANSLVPLISSTSTSSQENLKRKSEDFNASGTPTKSSRFS